MILGIKQEDCVKNLKNLEQLSQRRQDLKTMDDNILDYMDFFEFVCIKEAVDSLPNKARKIYNAKLESLLEDLKALRKSAQKDHNKHRMHYRLDRSLELFKNFVCGAFNGSQMPASRSLSLLIESEYSIVVAREIFNILNEQSEAEEQK